MSLQPTRRRIDDVEYDFYHISVRKLNKLLIKIVKLVGEPMANSVDSSVIETAKQDKEAAKDMVDIGKVVKALSSSLDEDTVDEIISSILEGTTCIGIGPVNQNFDKVFTKLLHLWKVVYEALDVYYGDFLQEGLGLLNKS